MQKEVALDVVLSCLRNAMEQFGNGQEGAVGTDTVIVGQSAVLDSIGLVSLIVDIEQRLEADHGIAVTLASEKAMSQRSSPFRTCGVLAEHVCSIIAEEQTA